MLGWLVQTTLAVGCLAAAVGLLCRIVRPRPAIQHALWAVVLLKFLTPTVVYSTRATPSRFVFSVGFRTFASPKMAAPASAGSHRTSAQMRSTRVIGGHFSRGFQYVSES